MKFQFIKTINYLILFIIVYSCSPSKKIERQQNPEAIILINEGPWKTNFKNMVFTNILSQMYGKEFSICCLSQDASNTANFDWLNFDTSVTNDISKLSKDFMMRSYLNGNIEGKKIKMNYALQYRNSQELDSITGIYYLKFKKDSIRNSIIGYWK